MFYCHSCRHAIIASYFGDSKPKVYVSRAVLLHVLVNNINTYLFDAHVFT